MIVNPLSNWPNAVAWEQRTFGPEIINSIYTETVVNSGTATVIDTVRGGAYQLAGANATDDSGAQAQNPNAWCRLDAGKRHLFLWEGVTWTETSATGASQIDRGLGLATVDTTILASAPTNQIGLEALDGATVWTLRVRVAGVETAGIAIPTYTIAKDAVMDIGIEVVENSAGTAADITVYINGASVLLATNVAVPTALLSDYVYAYSGEATGLKSMSLKRFSAAQQK